MSQLLSPMSCPYGSRRMRKAHAQRANARRLRSARLNAERMLSPLDKPRLRARTLFP